MMAEVQIARVTALPEQFDALRAEAVAEGHNHIETMWAQWQDGSKRFDRPGERLVVAHIGGALAGIGGITEDFVDPTFLRMRRFYVRPACRRGGVGRGIASFVLTEAMPLGRQIVLFAESAEAGAFWEAMAFVPVEREKTTHVLVR
jgi:GNAT superfamily N-acetyltransferase